MDGEISADELADLLDADSAVRVVDIRSKHAYEMGHIPGSVNIPFAQLPQRVGELTGNDRIVTVCPHGLSSVQAAKLIGSYEGTADTIVESLAPGIEGWLEREYPWEQSAPEASDGPESPF